MISFNSISFYLFIALFGFVFSKASTENAKKYILFIINVFYLSLLFYFRKKHLLIFSGHLIFIYFGLRLLQTSIWKKTISGGLILSSLIFLCFFKYTIIQGAVLAIIPSASTFLKPAIFLGISFFSFRLISLIVDTIDEDEKIDFFHYINYLIFFPSFMMGPLDRFERHLSDAKNEGKDKENRGYSYYYPILERIILGAFKKIVIADTLLPFSLASLNDLDLAGVGTSKVFISHYFYYFVLYFDFSGYCDIAIGVGKLFGIKLPENFNHPYKARNIQDFWNRWHITFMEWLKDYLYFPILRVLLNINNNFIVTATCISFFLTFLLAGIWHGDGIHFVILSFCHLWHLSWQCFYDLVYL
jgi:alginate O-acetyltransferase complex protein AlgI